MQYRDSPAIMQANYSGSFHIKSHPKGWTLRFQNLIKFGIHVRFHPQTSNLKFFIDRTIGFPDMGGYFLKILRKNGGEPNFQ